MKIFVKIILFITITFVLTSCEVKSSNSIPETTSIIVKTHEIHVLVSNSPTQGTEELNTTLPNQKNNETLTTKIAHDVEDSNSTLTHNAIPSTAPLPNDMDTSTSNEEGISQVDYNKEYNFLISEWKSALNNFKSGDHEENNMLSFSFYDMSDSNSAKAYYALYDIDGNGTSELILRKEKNYEDITAYIFTMKDSKAINIFGYDYQSKLIEVPWSRVGSSVILSNGLIDSIYGDYAIYRITDDGGSVQAIVSSEPYDYPDMANLADAKWRYYVNNEQVDYDFYVQYLNEQGYMLEGNNTLAKIDWVALD